MIPSHHKLMGYELRKFSFLLIILQICQLNWPCQPAPWEVTRIVPCLPTGAWSGRAGLLDHWKRDCSCRSRCWRRSWTSWRNAEEVWWLPEGKFETKKKMSETEILSIKLHRRELLSYWKQNKYTVLFIDLVLLRWKKICPFLKANKNA